jgi:hypothetical protein
MLTNNKSNSKNMSLADRPAELPEKVAQALLLSLRHKEGTWVDWGQACQQLHKAGHDPQLICEETGFEPIQQNLVIVAAQVYDSLVQTCSKGGAATEALTYFQGPRSDVLYELRLLNQDQRWAAAELAFAKKLDVDEAHQLVKAIKDFARVSAPPEFTTEPGDAVAYQCWKRARTQKDIQERSRLIARGLQFAQSTTARQQIENLLTDFTVVAAKKAPLLPFYRLEQEEELPRIVPVVGALPLTIADLKAVPLLEETEPFRMVHFTGTGAWIPIPGWPAVIKAEDPVAILCRSEEFGVRSSEFGVSPFSLGDAPRTETLRERRRSANGDAPRTEFQTPNSEPRTPNPELLVVIDRAARHWSVYHYFLVEQGEQLGFQWFEEEPEQTLLGQLLLVLRPKRILDETVITSPWQMDD